MTRIITLTLSPAFDLHCSCADFRAHHENLAHITSYNAGGKGVNISAALTQNGTPNLAIVVLGRENAAEFERCLNDSRIVYRPIYRDGRIRENITLHDEKNRETRISFKGFSADNGLLEDVSSILNEYIGQDELILTLTGRVPDEIDRESLIQWLLDLQARGVKLVIDSKSLTREHLLTIKPWLIKPNEEELAIYAKKATASPYALAISEAKAFYGGGISFAMVSLGADGALLASDEGICSASAPRIDPVSTVGAGDSAIAGFLSAYAQKKSASECLTHAIAFGSAACLTTGTNPPLPEDVARLKNLVKITKL